MKWLQYDLDLFEGERPLVLVAAFTSDWPLTLSQLGLLTRLDRSSVRNAVSGLVDRGALVQLELHGRKEVKANTDWVLYDAVLRLLVRGAGRALREGVRSVAKDDVGVAAHWPVSPGRPRLLIVAPTGTSDRVLLDLSSALEKQAADVAGNAAVVRAIEQNQYEEDFEWGEELVHTIWERGAQLFGPPLTRDAMREELARRTSDVPGRILRTGSDPQVSGA
ncbi:MAG: hypothetical protein ACRDT9_05825 [Agromyces sp.]